MVYVHVVWSKFQDAFRRIVRFITIVISRHLFTYISRVQEFGEGWWFLAPSCSVCFVICFSDFSSTSCLKVGRRYHNNYRDHSIVLYLCVCFFNFFFLCQCSVVLRIIIIYWLLYYVTYCVMYTIITYLSWTLSCITNE